MNYLSSCSIVKNESDYIYDFYKIHKHLGVENFLFFDRTTVGKPLLEIFAGHSDVEIIHFPEPNRHAAAWKEGVIYLTGKSKWVQFIDIDQVTVPLQTNDIKIMLQPYENYGCLSLNWHTFGSSHLDVEPTISTYESYTWRADDQEGINAHVQSIVQVEKALPVVWADPHHPRLKPGIPQVNESKVAFNGPFNKPITHNVGFIAHYYTRSREYWRKKIEKTRADTGTSVGSLDDFDNHQRYLNKVQDFRVSDIWSKT